MAENQIKKNDLRGIISSVVPSRAVVVEEAVKGLSEPDEADVLIVSQRLDSGLTFKVRNPEGFGTDRLAGAVGAFNLYAAPVAVVDFGTATTITVVDADANCIGGAIMPGLGLMNNSLTHGTSGLPGVSLEPPEAALGKDTPGCMRSGIFYGSAGAVERVLSEIEQETGLRLRVIITGGYGQMMETFIRRSHYSNPHLLLEGLRILYEKNGCQ
jgi:type III pantothenate kinase